jgi:2'-5' RNA ligase
MADVRSFVAVDLGAPVKTQLGVLQHELKARTPAGAVRWVPPDAVHLTLKFLGDVPEERVGEIVAALQRVCGPLAPLSFSVAGAGCFPNLRRPNVVWVGVEDPSGALRALQAAVEKALNPLGFPPENRPFKPHLTLGRTQRNAPGEDLRAVGERVGALAVGTLGQVDVREILLMRSDLLPGGARYTPLARILLGGAEA